MRRNGYNVRDRCSAHELGPTSLRNEKATGSNPVSSSNKNPPDLRETQAIARGSSCSVLPCLGRTRMLQLEQLPRVGVGPALCESVGSVFGESNLHLPTYGERPGDQHKHWPPGRLVCGSG